MTYANEIATKCILLRSNWMRGDGMHTWFQHCEKNYMKKDWPPEKTQELLKLLNKWPLKLSLKYEDHEADFKMLHDHG